METQSTQDTGQQTLVMSDKKTGNIKMVGFFGNRANLNNVMVPPNLNKDIFAGEKTLDMEGDVVRHGKVVSRFTPDISIFKQQAPFSVLFMRHVGLGDAVICASLARYVKKHWPDSWVAISVPEKWGELFEWIVDVDEVIDCIIRKIPVNKYDAAFRLDGIFDMQRDSAITSRPALLYRYLGLENPAEAMDKPWFEVPARNKNIANNWMREQGINRTHRLVGIQIDSMAPLRSIPADIRNSIIAGLLEDPTVKVIQFGLTTSAPSSRPLEFPGAYDATNLKLPLTGALMSMCDVMVAPDSGLMHLACALGVPTVALFGTMPARLRTEFYPTAHPIEAEDPGCGRFPCNDMANNEGWGMNYCFDREGHGSMCMRMIPASKVVAKVWEILGILPENFDADESRAYVLEPV